MTPLIQNGKAGDETAGNSNIDISDTNEGDETVQQSSIDVYKNLEYKVGNKFARNNKIAVNRIHEDEIEVSIENKAKMIDSDEPFDVKTPWNTNYDVSIDIVPSVRANESDQSNKDDQIKILSTTKPSVSQVPEERQTRKQQPNNIICRRIKFSKIYD